MRGRAREFIGRFPDRSDVLAVIEVADSSLVYDRRTKQRLYAAMSLPIYLIVNLQEDAVELYGRPIPAEQRYETRIELHRGETILMMLGELGEIRLDVDELL